MATAGIPSGTLIGLYVGATKVGNLTANGFSVNIQTRETTNKDTGGWDTFLASNGTWTMDAEGFFAEDATYGYEDLYDALVAKTAVTIMTSSEVTGDKTYTGSAIITSLERSHPDKENVTFSVSFQGTGSLTKATKA